MIGVRVSGFDTSADETDNKSVTWENNWRSLEGVSIRFHKFVNALPSWHICKKKLKKYIILKLYLSTHRNSKLKKYMYGKGNWKNKWFKQKELSTTDVEFM